MANAVVTGGGTNYADILSTPYGLKGEISPDLALEQQSLNRRQQLAHLLLQQAGKVAPGQMVGRFYVGPDWKEGLTSLGSGIAGLGATIANQRQQEDISKEAQQTREEDIAEFLRSQKDVPAVPPSNLDPGTFGARAQTVSAPAPREAVSQAMMEQGAPQAAPPAAPVDPILPGAAPPGFSGNYPVGEMPDESGWAPKGPIGDLNAEAPTGPPPPAMQVAQAMAQPMQGPVSEGTIGRERTPEERQAALIRLMASRDPQAAAIGRFLAQQEAMKAEKDEAREARKAERTEALDVRKEGQKMHHEEIQALRAMQDQQFQMTYENSSRHLEQQHQANMDRLRDARTSHADTVRLTEDQHRIERERLSLESSKAAREKMPTDAQGAANLFAGRADIADQIMSSLEGQYSPLAIDYKQRAGNIWLFGGALEAGANAAMSKESQRAEQAQRDFVNAVLRKESGAVISKEEFDNARKQYFPQQGDTAEVISQKAQNRQTEIQGLRQMSGTLNPGIGAKSSPTPPAASAIPAAPTPHAPYHDPKEEAQYQEYKKQEREKFDKTHRP